MRGVGQLPRVVELHDMLGVVASDADDFHCLSGFGICFFYFDAGLSGDVEVPVAPDGSCAADSTRDAPLFAV